MPTAASSSKIRQNRLFCGVADCRASASPRQRIATLKVFSRDIFDSYRQSLRLLGGLAAPEEQADAGEQQQAEDDSSKPRLVQPAEGFQAGPGAERQGRQSEQESTAVAEPIMPVPPSHSAIITKVATPTGWKTARCSAGGQPRKLHHTTAARPASPVAPPTTPLTTPTVPSAIAPARAATAESGRNQL